MCYILLLATAYNAPLSRALVRFCKNNWQAALPLSLVSQYCKLYKGRSCNVVIGVVQGMFLIFNRIHISFTSTLRSVLP